MIRRRDWLLAIVFMLGAMAVGSTLLRANGIALVVQNHRSFNLAAVTVTRGDTVRFTNEDAFNHQVFIKSPNFAFESREQAPGETVDVAFSKLGVFDVQCGIHPRMHLSVTVE